MTKYATIAAYVAAWIFGTAALIFVVATIGGSFIDLKLWTPLESEGWRTAIVILSVGMGPFGLVHGDMKADPA